VAFFSRFCLLSMSLTMTRMSALWIPREEIFIILLLNNSRLMALSMDFKNSFFYEYAKILFLSRALMLSIESTRQKKIFCNLITFSSSYFNAPRQSICMFCKRLKIKIFLRPLRRRWCMNKSHPKFSLSHSSFNWTAPRWRDSKFALWSTWKKSF
jgi:hypothetical protein